MNSWAPGTDYQGGRTNDDSGTIKPEQRGEKFIIGGDKLTIATLRGVAVDSGERLPIVMLEFTEKALLTPAETATYLGVSRSVHCRFVMRDDIVCYRLWSDVHASLIGLGRMQ